MDKDPKNILGKIAHFFIERYRVVYLMIIAIALFGAYCYKSLPREEMPEVVMPMGMVSVSYTGAAPQEMESLVTDPIETKLKELDDVDSVSSTSGNGSTSIRVTFDTGVDIDEKISEMQDLVREVENELPDDASTPLVRGFESNDRPFIRLNISGDYDLADLKTIGENLQEEIESFSGVDEVTLAGGLDREIDVYIDPLKLITYNLSMNEIANVISNSNFNAPGGNVELDGLNVNVRTVGEFNSIEELENIIITKVNNTPLYLKDIASIHDTYASPSSYSRLYHSDVSVDKETTPTISLSVLKNSEGDVVSLSNTIKQFIKDEKGKLYPEDVFIAVTGDTAVEVNQKLKDVSANAISGLFIVIIVLFLIIGLRESFIVAFAIPLSLLSSFILMTYNDITLNSMSLVALILALGMLVDNAIVIMESIDQLRDDGLDVVTAAKKATNRVAPAVFAATLTTIAAFYPMALSGGMMGEFLKSIPMTVMFAIGSSFVISIIITPALCSRFLTKHKTKNKQHANVLSFIRKIISIVFVVILALFAFANDGHFGVLSWITAAIFGILMGFRVFTLDGQSLGEIHFIKKYIHILDGILKSRVKKMSLILISVVLFIGSIFTVTHGILKIELMPSSDSNSLSINIETPPGYLLEDTESIASKIEEVVLGYPEVQNISTRVGSGGSMRSSGGSNSASISIDLVDTAARERSSTQIIDSLRKDFRDIAGCKITIGQRTFGPSSGKPINVQISGQDSNNLEQVAQDVKDMLKELDGTADVSTSLEDGNPQVQIKVDREKASILGVSISTITSQIRNALQGVDASSIEENGEEIDIILRTNNDTINSVNDFDKIYFTSSTGEKVQFSRVAYLEETKGASGITHQDFNKIVSVESNVKTGVNSTELLRELQDKLKDYILPSDVSISFEGEMRYIRESFTNLFIAMMVAIFLVFVILSIQFNSLSQPFVILFSVPMAIIGAIGGLILTNNNFGVFAFMGIVSLVGIAVNDAIVLVDYINYLRKKRYTMIAAIKAGVKSRFLPVMATSITTIGGILPLALKDPDYAQMGFALIFGLIASTVLTLLIIPILYSIVEGLKIKIQKKIPIFVDNSFPSSQI